MPKRRKYETNFLKQLVEEYIEQKIDYQKIIYADLVKYCRDTYISLGNLNYQDFSRNAEIEQMITGYNERLETKLLDINKSEFISQDRLIDARLLYGKDKKDIDKVVIVSKNRREI